LSAIKMADDPQNRKSRARQACEPCRKKKTKCSGEYPVCTHCAAHGFECSYIAVEKRRGPQKGYVRALESRLNSLQSLLEDYVDKLSPSSFNKNRADQLLDGGEVFFDESERGSLDSSPSINTAENQPVTSLVVKGDRIEKPKVKYFLAKKKARTAHLSSSTLSTSYPRKSAHMTMVVDGSCKYLGESSGAYLIQNGEEETQSLQTPQCYNSLFAYPALAPDFTVPKSQIDALVVLFFSTTHLFFPILIRDDFMEEYGKPAPNLPQPLIDAVCGCSCAYVSRSTVGTAIKNPLQLGEALYIRSRQKILSQVDQTSLFNIQALLLLSTCHHLNVGNLGWMSLGIALRMAIEMGLHREHLPERTDPPIVKERELRRRVWWGCYILDRTASVTSGRPLTLDDDEYDTCFPDMDGETNDAACNLASTYPRIPSFKHRKKYFYKSIELWKIYGKVTRNVYSVRSRQGYSALKLQSHIQHLVDTLQDWYTGLLRDWPQLKDDYSLENECYKFGLLLKLSYHSLLILLYRPLLPRPGSPISTFVGVFYEKCKAAALEIVGLIRNHIDSFIDLASPFKFYPVLVSFSIHLLGASASVSDAKQRASSKLLVIDCLSVLSYLYETSPLCVKIIFGFFKVLASLDIIPIGYVDPRWPEPLKKLSKLYSDFAAKCSRSEGDQPCGAQSDGKTEHQSIVIRAPAVSVSVAQPTPTTSPAKFLQAQGFSDQKAAGAFSTQANQACPEAKVSFSNNLQTTREPLQTAIFSSPRKAQMKQGSTGRPQEDSHTQLGKAGGEISQETALDQLASQQQRYNNFLQSQAVANAPMLPFGSGQMPVPNFPNQIFPYSFPTNPMFMDVQAFSQNAESFLWDPLYNADFSSFNNGF
ncbi:hypothetical protein L0F63_004842, partial [Massospora cicadina]